MIIKITQADIDAAGPRESNGNRCVVAQALTRYGLRDFTFYVYSHCVCLNDGTMFEHSAELRQYIADSFDGVEPAEFDVKCL